MRDLQGERTTGESETGFALYSPAGNPLPWVVDRSDAGATAVLRRLYPIEKFAQFFYLGLAVLILFFATSVAATSKNGWQTAGDFLRVAGCSFLVASAAATVGCLIGFLFGIPRTPAGLHILASKPRQESEREPAQSGEPEPDKSIQKAPTQQESQTEQVKSEGLKPGSSVQKEKPADHSPYFLINTSLEQISDWLTTIIIGLSLVQFHSFLQTLKVGAIDAAKFIVPTAAGTGDAWPFFLGLMVASFVSAGILVYLETRTRLTLLFIGVPAKEAARPDQRGVA